MLMNMLGKNGQQTQNCVKDILFFMSLKLLDVHKEMVTYFYIINSEN